MNSYLLEVLATNCFRQRYILLNTTQDMIKMGLRPASVRSVACFPKPVLKGFHLTPVPLTNGELPGQQEIIRAYQHYPALFNLRHHPVIGEVQTGVYAGERIALFTQEEIRAHFSLDAIRQAVKKQTLYSYTRWWQAKDYAEAQPYYCRADRDKILGLLRYRVEYSPLTLTAHDHVIFRRQVKAVAQALYSWYVADYVKMKPSALNRLVDIYIQLTRTIRCEDHFFMLTNTLWALNGVLLREHTITSLNLHTHIKALENIAARS